VTPSNVGQASRVGSQAQSSQPATVDEQRQDVALRGNDAPQPTPARQQEQSARDLAQATQDISQYIQTVSRSLQISVDKDLGSTVITVLNADTDEVVRQIPREEVLQIARFLAEQKANAEADSAITGLLFNDQA
jgi:flagellar protein FlaG